MDDFWEVLNLCGMAFICSRQASHPAAASTFSTKRFSIKSSADRGDITTTLVHRCSFSVTEQEINKRGIIMQ